MQEQVNEKTVAVIIKGTKLTARMLEKALAKLLADMKKHKRKSQTPKTYRGKQSVKSLVRQGGSITNVPITDGNIKSFERVARKYGIDYSLKKDASSDPPRWLVFFKSKDSDALTAAFNEYTSKSVKTSDKPSILSVLNKMKDHVKSQSVDKVRNKDKGLDL